LALEDTDQNGMGSGGPPGGRRPENKDGGFKSYDSHAKTNFDAKGKKILMGYAPGQNFKKKSAPEIAGEVKEAAQEAPEAIEQQRIPKASKEMMKGYFKNLGGQGEKEKK
jgi:hypothetical protein